MDVYFQDNDPNPYAWLKVGLIVLILIIGLILIL